MIICLGIIGSIIIITVARSGWLTLAHRRSSKGSPLWACYLDIIYINPGLINPYYRLFIWWGNISVANYQCWGNHHNNEYPLSARVYQSGKIWFTSFVLVFNRNRWLRTPCLTRARSGGDAFWVTSHGRFLTLKDWIPNCQWHYRIQVNHWK